MRRSAAITSAAAVVGAAVATWLLATPIPAQHPGPPVKEGPGAAGAPETEPGAAGTAEYVWLTPRIQGYGAVTPLASATDGPRPGARVLFDVSASAPGPAHVVPGLEDAAELINLYGLPGGGAPRVQVAVLLHGPATPAALSDPRYGVYTSEPANPNLPLIEALRAHGAQVLVDGQSLAHYHFARDEVAPGVDVALSAMTLAINRQLDGWALLPYRGLQPYTDMPR